MKSKTEKTEPQPQPEPAILTVKTVYARAAIILLALNFALTGYVTYNMSQAQQETLESLQSNRESTTPTQGTKKMAQPIETHPVVPSTGVEPLPPLPSTLDDPDAEQQDGQTVLEKR